MIELALSLEGFDTIAPADVTASLDLATAEAPSAILLDLKMPGFDAMEFARRYRAGVADPAPLVLVTAATDAASAAEAIGAARYVRKPFDVAELLRAVREVVPA